MDIQRDNLWYRQEFEKIFESVRLDYPSLCGYSFYGSVRKGVNSPSDIDAMYIYDSEIQDISPEERIKILDTLESVCKTQLGIPIHRDLEEPYEIMLEFAYMKKTGIKEADYAFINISGNRDMFGRDLEERLHGLLRWIPDLKIEDFKVNEKARQKIASVLKVL